MKFLGIIPARYQSTRLPGKPLELIGDLPMIIHVYRQARKAACLSDVVVATDDERIMKVVEDNDGKAILTSPNHTSGTDRSFEALQKYGGKFDYVVNIQGDEPFIDPDQINLLGSLCDGKTEIATLVKQIMDESQLTNPNIVKAVVSKTSKALYFSRSPIPYYRDAEVNSITEVHDYWKHIGMYAYRTDILKKITALSQSALEIAESLEQLRWLENDFEIRIAKTNISVMGIDTMDDLVLARNMWENR